MLYRRVGCSGLRSSVLSIGTASLDAVHYEEAVAIFRGALDAGITHFDTAEAYGNGQSEVVLSKILAEIGVPREKIIISTKAFTYGWSQPPGAAHEVRSLSRKYLLDAIDRSLTKLGTDYIDIFHCHQMDPDTPAAELVNTMDAIIRSGKARYWAVSNWDSRSLGEVCEYADRHGRELPIVDQIEYNLLFRTAVGETADVMGKYGPGVSVWGPLAGGLLSGKYLTGVPQGSRAEAMASIAQPLSDRLIDKERNAIVAQLAEIAAQIGCTVSQLSIAWCLLEPKVATVITAASKLHQLQDNIGAITAFEKLAPDVVARIEEVVGGHSLSNVPEEMRNG